MAKIKTLRWILLLIVLDTLIPLPLFGFFALYLLIRRPPWFARLVRKIYRSSGNTKNMAKNRY